MTAPSDRLNQYGVAPPLAEKAVAAGLTASMIRSLPKVQLESKFGLEEREAAELKKCVQRRPIKQEVVDLLLTRSNHVCCVCKGEKSTSVVIHHIVEYEKSQDNDYANLALLCPNDHDRAHSGGLALGLTAEQIRREKINWEKRVAMINVRRAAQALHVDSSAIDYMNIMRIEEMCLQLFGSIPTTTISESLRCKGILGPDLRFDEVFVRNNLSGGNYLFDYVNSGEAEHFRQLLAKLSEAITFEDLSEAAYRGIRKLQAIEGKHAFFVGGVRSKQPSWPIVTSQPFEWRFNKSTVEITWHGDAKYLISSSAMSRQGQLNRYIIYGRVRTVHRPARDRIQVSCSPLFAAQPCAYVDRTPAIAWRRRFRDDEVDNENEDDIAAGA